MSECTSHLRLLVPTASESWLASTTHPHKLSHSQVHTRRACSGTQSAPTISTAMASFVAGCADAKSTSSSAASSSARADSVHVYVHSCMGKRG